MHFITAEEASAKASDAPSESDIALKAIFMKIRKAASKQELKTSVLIPRDQLSLYGGYVKNTLEENGYTVVIEEFKKVAPIMKSVGICIVGW